jgi:AraC family transcriptional regulator
VVNVPRKSTEFELRLSNGLVELAHLRHDGATSDLLAPRGSYWIDLCLTPRRPDAKARYVDRWGEHRYSEMGSLIALLPGEALHLRTAGGRHTSITCQIPAERIDRWLPDDFVWTDRRLETCLNITNVILNGLLARLSKELQRPGPGGNELAEAIVAQISIELARHLIDINEPEQSGGLANWRLALIAKRVDEPGPVATLDELARLCNVSARHLTRAFRISRGCSIGAYIEQSRIDAAKRRLVTRESIKSIATSLGYASQSTFTSAFRRMTGTTPARFRVRVAGGGTN